MEKRFIQANKEARWSFGLTLGYFFCWWILFYFSGHAEYRVYLMGHIDSITGLPLWFEVGCISLPLVFIGLCILMVKLIFSDMPLEKLKDQD
ncbi:hypothetical protein BJP41_02045 [Candidatus Williamhamiltonella defendens]|uniref:DUF997 domain-containing protein n=2 Tax=Candidatus Williamhamiltonella defendens TaxID=138072 RepID=A0A2D3T682_9ENTR|nr:DUF997 family protein [Candidatus Hamiltonella defensa]ACQ67541.1 hypothetical protein HDEF_0819 [Candidatus Hamiltonella defensa 5AT (Acyrthosiphon pisum)]ASV33689.1 DUF997 domain-containing protein [Candidatus Hamiltonella defensa]ATW22245.1 hypothetical protein BJP44_03745 [Candidatus Hamiltonella defensa]ATW29323.1 hypothetical protein BJP41_02045 [Candidatus Hamiltonella defensa]ATW31300.1 hypothetical protein BJP42_02105 [Candidatus Hamiltonella defensa]